MKGIIRNIALNSVSLYTTSLLFDGLILHGGIAALIMGGLLLAIGFKILKPILMVITLPFNLISLGLFSTCIIAFILFLITLVYPQIVIQPFHFDGFLFGGVEIHPFQVSLLLSYFVISVTIYLTTQLINWIFD